MRNYTAFIVLGSGELRKATIRATSLYDAKFKLNYYGGIMLEQVALWLPPVDTSAPC